MKINKKIVFLLSSVLVLAGCGTDKKPSNENENTEDTQETVKKGTVTIGTLSNGQITPSKTEGEVGEQIALTVSPSKGYEVDKVIANGEILNKSTTGTYNFNLKEGVNNVSATFKAIDKTATVVLVDTVNGTIEADKLTGKEGDDVKLTVTPKANYEIYKVKVNGEVLEANDAAEYIFKLVEGTNIVHALFKKIGGEVELRESTVTLGDGTATNGTVTSSAAKGLEGDTVTLTASANSGYRLDSLTFNGANLAVDAEGKVKVVLVAGANTVTARFVSIVVDPDIYVFSMEERESFTNYTQQKTQGKFKDKTQILKVGNENEFLFRPVVKTIAIKPNEAPGEPEVNDDWGIKATLAVFDEAGQKFVDLTSDTLGTYANEINEIQCKVQFKEAAIGKKFKLSYHPDKLTSKQESNEKFFKEVEFEVVKGFNIYNANDMAYINNLRVLGKNEKRDGGNDVYTPFDANYGISSNRPAEQKSNYVDAWNTFKTDNGLSLDKKISNAIFQDNIHITKDNLPEAFFINESDGFAAKYNGLLYDYASLYQRAVSKEDGSFTIEGNYFDLDASAIPVVGLEDNSVKEDRACEMSHAQLFKFTGYSKKASKDEDGNITAPEERVKVGMQNINTIGNAPKLGDVVLSGGLIMNKVIEPDFEIYNNVATCWFITYYSGKDSDLAKDTVHSQYTINKCIARDAFNTFIYSWGGYCINIIDSSLVDAGGPCMITDRVEDREDGDSKHTSLTDDAIPTVNVFNSELHSRVEGTEGWFNAMKATAIVPDIKALNAALTPFGKTFISTKAQQANTYMDFVWLNKCGRVQGISDDTSVTGNFNVYKSKTELDYSFNYFNTTRKDIVGERLTRNTVLNTIYNNYIEAKQLPPFFEFSNQGFLGIIPPNEGSKDPQPIFVPSTDPQNLVEAGRILQAPNNMACLYYGGMAIGLNIAGIEK